MFNLKRFYHFLKLNLYLQRKLILWLGVVFGFLFLFSANVGPNQSFFFTVGLFLGGFMLTSQVFADIHNPNFSIQALTLPVSSSERYLALWLLTGPIYFIALLLLYSIAILAHIISHFFWGDWQLSTLGLADLALEYLIFNAFFLLGAVLFKRLALIKTILSLFVLFLLSVALRSALGDNLPLTLMNWGSLMFWGALAIISWCLGWYRLKQTQLK